MGSDGERSLPLTGVAPGAQADRAAQIGEVEADGADSEVLEGQR
ncbi:hypothetical protein ACFVG1_00420 [Streptomyces bacillaris]